MLGSTIISRMGDIGSSWWRPWLNESEEGSRDWEYRCVTCEDIYLYPDTNVSCPNCGDSKRIHTNSVKRKISIIRDLVDFLVWMVFPQIFIYFAAIMLSPILIFLSFMIVAVGVFPYFGPDISLSDVIEAPRMAMGGYSNLYHIARFDGDPFIYLVELFLTPFLLITGFYLVILFVSVKAALLLIEGLFSALIIEKFGLLNYI